MQGVYREGDEEEKKKIITKLESGDTSGVDVGGNPYGMDDSDDFSNSDDNFINYDNDFGSNYSFDNDSFSKDSFSGFNNK